MFLMQLTYLSVMFKRNQSYKNGNEPFFCDRKTHIREFFKRHFPMLERFCSKLEGR